MFMVVLLHNLLQGGILDWTLDSPKDLIYATLENFAIIAVNVFALISGYLGVEHKTRITRIVHLWEAAYTWSATTAILGVTIGTEIDNWFWRSFFPVLGNCYWYFNSFLVVQLFTPILNIAIPRLSRSRLLVLATTLVTATSLLGFPGGLGISGGYSTFWLLTLWIAGAAMRLNWDKLNSAISNKRLIVASLIIPILSTVLEREYVFKGLDPTQWIQYTSPLVILQSFCFFALAVRIKVKGEATKKLLGFLSPLAFGVYLIDSSVWFFDIFLANRLTSILELRAYLGVPATLLLSFSMFAIFLAMEAARTVVMNKIVGYNSPSSKRIEKISHRKV